jgi:hypothetical protein
MTVVRREEFQGRVNGTLVTIADVFECDHEGTVELTGDVRWVRCFECASWWTAGSVAAPHRFIRIRAS